jgi:hypothetical protein
MSFLKYLLFCFGFTVFLYLNNSNLTYSHIPTNNQIVIQEIVNQHDKIKVQFAYDQDKIKINTLTDLKFSVLNSTTEEHIKNFLARVVVTEGSELFGFDNITVNNGDFSVNHSFANYGSHQVILRVDTNSSIIPASFNVMIPFSQLPSSSSSSSSSPFLVDSDKSKLDSDKSTQNFITYLIIGIGVLVSVGMVTILLKKLKKK